MRKITYREAINEALYQLLEDKKTVLIGQGVTSPWYAGGTTVGLLKRFGQKRVIDTPVSESAITGVTLGSSLTGSRPILMHPRMDFMFYALDQIANHAANWHYMFQKLSMPVVFWSIINRGGEQGAQHSQALQSIFAHFPGLKVVMPSTPHDAKGLLIAAAQDNNPVMFIDERWLYDIKGEVPKKKYIVKIGKAAIRKKGKDLTIIATSYMVQEAMKAAEKLSKENIHAEVIDLRSIKPFDEETLVKSVKKTGRLVIADGGWKTFGISAEISASIQEQTFSYLKSKVERVALPDIPAPASCVLEKAYYPTEKNIVAAAKKTMLGKERRA